MTTILMAQNATAEVLADADLPIRIYFEPANEEASVDDRDYLELTRDCSLQAYNGLPVYVVSYQRFDGWALEGDFFNYDSLGEEHFMAKEHAVSALLERSSPDHDPQMGSTPSARTQVAQLVTQSFEKTLGQAGPSLGSILASMLGEQLSTDLVVRRDQIFAAFVSADSVDYNGQEAHIVFTSRSGQVTLPGWKWLEIQVAYVALRFLQFRQDGPAPTWEEVWDGTTLGSSQIISVLDHALAPNPPSNVGGWAASVNVAALRPALLDMASLSLRIKAHLAEKAA